MQAVLVKADGVMEQMELGADDKQQLESLKTAVGGWLEAVPLQIKQTPGLILWANEEGYRLELVPNPSASAVASLAGLRDPILGDVVFTGSADGQGGFKDIPEYWARVFLNRKADNNA